ncbi:uncharacterized protein DUF1080 [Thermosporothrix hazakensis]|jgi:hypothetical protein|uniref:Uncharacterized protein DUF1080 n=2 Tax=Thermosporothrix TaxID=768650 RepID=A0A326U8T2_THEHA|nr:family 16 glycoside hydrolase [Thermosporothrix hazakensis]PZW31995.1 uncharacterized protein DUF1080 [Thermosporothrix hazakensis]BBH91533.1 hypothetical protein KTC_62840 [Thermosporothrix sp. COM3]GCE49679.1 hypothetical protein KTH_45480 [Thermosporothrix hazakensis]
MVEEHLQPKQDTKYRRKWRLILLFVCLLVLIAGSSIYMVVRATGKQEQQEKAKHITPTVAHPTETPTATVTPSALFSDDFSEANKGWLISNNDGYIRSVSEEGLLIGNTNHRITTESIPVYSPFTDFELTTTFVFQAGDDNDSIGLYLRGDNNLDHNYRIEIYGNNTYTIARESWNVKNHSPEETMLVDYTTSKALKPRGQANTLRVTMQGSTLQLFINGQHVQTVEDSEYQQGQIALFVRNGFSSGGAQALFQQVEVYPLPTPDTTATPTLDSTP